MFEALHLQGVQNGRQRRVKLHVHHCTDHLGDFANLQSRAISSWPPLNNHLLGVVQLQVGPTLESIGVSSRKHRLIPRQTYLGMNSWKTQLKSLETEGEKAILGC